MKIISSKTVLLLAGISVTALSTAIAGPVFAQATEKAAASPDDTVVVVTARRKALQNATERKKNSDTMIDSIVADEAGKLPDNSITEVLQRVSGVSIVRFGSLGDPDHFSAEGSGIQVRGLSGVTGLLNGREVFSANGGGGLSWGDITPELMAAVDVYKANRADMIEGGTGGSIDLRTKMPFDYKKPALEMSLGASYGDFSKATTPSASILAAKRWDTPVGEMGFLVDLAYSDYAAADSFTRTEPYWTRKINGVDRYVPGGFNWGDDQFSRQRTGIYTAFQWRPTDNLTIYQTFFQSRYQSENTSAGAFLNSRGNDSNSAGVMPENGTAATFDDNGALLTADHMVLGANGISNGDTMSQGWIPQANRVTCNTPYGSQASGGLNWATSPDVNGGFPTCTKSPIPIGSSRGYSKSDNITRDFSQGFTWLVSEDLRVKADLQFVDSSAKGDSFGIGLNSSAAGFSMDLTGDFPIFIIDNADALKNKANYAWDNASERVTNNHGTMGALNLDIDYHLGDGFFKNLKVGGRYADRVERDNFDGSYWAAVGRGWNNSAQRTLSDGSPDDSELYTFDDYFKGEVALPGLFYFPSAKLVQSQDEFYVQNTYGYDGQNTGKPPIEHFYHDPFGFAHTRILTRAVYLQSSFGSDEGLFGVPFTGNLGLRVVRNKVEASGFATFGQNRFYETQAEANADRADDGIANNAWIVAASGDTRVDGNDYTRYLPSLNINFKPTDKLFFRVAANVTMSPPGYNDIRAVGSSGITTNANANNRLDDTSTQNVNEAINDPNILSGITTSSGNPKLKPTMSKNLDLAVEWYASNSFNVHFDLFHKTLDDLIIYGDTVKPFPAITATKPDGTTKEFTGLTAVSSEVFNATEAAKINGFEIGGRKFFDELPAPFNGIGIEANYTFIDSENPSAKAFDINGQRMAHTPIVGMSRENYNIQLMYEKNKFSVRLAYSWRSKYLQATNANGTNGQYWYYPTPGTATGRRQITVGLPVYGDAYGQLDFGFNYRINNHARAWLQANNITNAVTNTSMEILPGKFYTRSWFVQDQRINVGLNLSF